MEREEVRELITEIFEEEALLLGAIVAVNHVDDEVVWRLARGLDSLRRQFLKQVDEVTAPVADSLPRGMGAEPHPAIEMLLRSIRQDLQGAQPIGA